MFGNRVKLDGELLRRAKEHAGRKGYASVEELITNLLEKELAGGGDVGGEDQEEMKKRLQGLGYIS